MTPLRIDDLGSSSKRFARHGGQWWPYRELRMEELAQLAGWLKRTESRCTLAITACWVTLRGRLIPFGERFPEQAGILRRLAHDGFVEIACHGLTHRQPGASVLRLNTRAIHREFTGLSTGEVASRLTEAKVLLDHTFYPSVVRTLVPPGNALTAEQARAARAVGFDLITAYTPQPVAGILDDRPQTVLHDRDLVGQVDRALHRLKPPYTTVLEWARFACGRAA